MISKNDVLRRGVELLLQENAREREQLLKLIGVSEPRNTRQNALDILKATSDTGGDTKPKVGKGGGQLYGPHNPHWTQMPKNKKRVAELARKSAKTRMKGASSNA